MALGGGTYLVQNKVLPGSYINFSSVARASAALSNRGVAAAPFAMSWGPEGQIFAVTSGDFQKNSKEIFGYSYGHDKLLAMREIFLHATTVYCYRINSGGVKAANTYATAKYAGTRGNDIKIVIAESVDVEDGFDVMTYLDGVQMDAQTVTAASDLVGNDWVVFKSDAQLAATAGAALTGGTDGTASGDTHQAFLDAVEPYAFNILCCPAADSTTVQLYTAFTKRMRDEVGSKFQLVAWQPSSADYEGVIGVWNTVTHAAISGVDTHALVYWAAGAQAGVAVNRSLTNAIYDGELTVNTGYTQADLEAALKAGKFILHNVNGTVRVLEDINTLLTLSDTKGEIFQSNQTMRVCDQIANDIAVLFATRYLGTVPNDKSGRSSLWGDVVFYLRQLESIRAVESFDDGIVACEQGDKKKSVLLTVNGLSIVNAMAQLYMSVVIQ